VVIKDLKVVTLNLIVVGVSTEINARGWLTANVQCVQLFDSLSKRVKAAFIVLVEAASTFSI